MRGHQRRKRRNDASSGRDEPATAVERGRLILGIVVLLAAGWRAGLSASGSTTPCTPQVMATAEQRRDFVPSGADRGGARERGHSCR